MTAPRCVCVCVFVCLCVCALVHQHMAVPCDNAETRDRTGDLQIFSLTLSQLSYRGYYTQCTSPTSAMLYDTRILVGSLPAGACKRSPLFVYAGMCNAVCIRHGDVVMRGHSAPGLLIVLPRLLSWRGLCEDCQASRRGCMAGALTWDVHVTSS